MVGIDPARPGLDATTVNNGTELEIVNGGPEPVVVADRLVAPGSSPCCPSPGRPGWTGLWWP